jgi:hypothetical protein
VETRIGINLEEAMNTVTNNRPRKTLAAQLDRLDQILDCLSDGLNEAVATAVKEAVGLAVQQAIQAVLTEVLMNPELLDKLRSSATPPNSADVEPATESVTTKVKKHLGLFWNQVRARLQQLRRGCVQVKQRVNQTWTSLWNRLQIVRQFKLQLLMALGVGVMAGVAAYFVGPWLSALVSGVGGFMTTLAVQAGLWLRRMLASTSFSEA